MSRNTLLFLTFVVYSAWEFKIVFKCIISSTDFTRILGYTGALHIRIWCKKKDWKIFHEKSRGRSCSKLELLLFLNYFLLLICNENWWDKSVIAAFDKADRSIQFFLNRNSFSRKYSWESFSKKKLSILFFTQFY